MVPSVWRSEEQGMCEIFILGYLAVLSVFDWRERKVPLILLESGGICAVICVVYKMIQRPHDFRWLFLTALLGCVPGVFLLVTARFTGKAGYGDGLALLHVGLFTNYKTSTFLLCLSMLLMSFFSVGAVAVKKAGRSTKVPYLPFLTAAYVAYVFFCIP